MHLTEKEYLALIGGDLDDAGKKKSKYKNQKVYVYANGLALDVKLPDKKPVMVFDSQKEYSRYLDLKLLERAKEISELDRQRVIVISEDSEYNGQVVKGINYKADFCYKDKNGNTVVEDVKPLDKNTGKYRTTKDFNLKWKLLKVKYPDYIFKIF